jgi:DNA polymerase-1
VTNVAIDIETSKAPFHLPWQPQAFVVCISTCDDNNETRTWFFEHEAATQTPRESIEELQAYLNKYDRLIAHNAKFDLHWLRLLGINTEKHKLWCTMVVEYLIRRHGNIQELSLAELSIHYGLPAKKDKVKIYWDAGIETNLIPAEILQVYCEQDTVNAMLIFREQTHKVAEMGLQKLLSLEMEVLRCYEDMEWNGMAVAVDLSREEDEKAQARLAEIDAELIRMLGIPNPGSNQQLSVGLFGGVITTEEYEDTGERFKTGARAGQIKLRKVQKELRIQGLGFDPKRLGIPETAKPGIYSVSKETCLPLLKAKTPEQKQVVELLYERSALDKLRSGYFASLPNLVVGGVVRSSINQALTKTGRLSSSAPNLQNIPRGKSPVKKLFVTRFL